MNPALVTLGDTGVLSAALVVSIAVTVAGADVCFDGPGAQLTVPIGPVASALASNVPCPTIPHPIGVDNFGIAAQVRRHIRDGCDESGAVDCHGRALDELLGAGVDLLDVHSGCELGDRGVDREHLRPLQCLQVRTLPSAVPFHGVRRRVGIVASEVHLRAVEQLHLGRAESLHPAWRVDAASLPADRQRLERDESLAKARPQVQGFRFRFALLQEPGLLFFLAKITGLRQPDWPIPGVEREKQICGSRGTRCGIPVHVQRIRATIDAQACNSLTREPDGPLLRVPAVEELAWRIAGLDDLHGGNGTEGFLNRVANLLSNDICQEPLGADVPCASRATSTIPVPESLESSTVGS
eukprot:3940070-Rhodomonas_salina.1